MKELSIEEKAKRYDEVIERVRKVLLDCTPEEQHVVEYISTGLSDSDDDRIRKKLLSSFKDIMKNADEDELWYGLSYNDIIAWLEKHYEPNPYSGVSFKCNGHTWGMCARDNGVDILLDKQLLKHLEKQGEQKHDEFDDTNAKRMFIKALERVEEQNNKGYKLTDCDKNSWWEDFKTYTSCKDKQKFDDIYPIFRVGDYIRNKKTSDKVLIEQLDMAAKAYCYVSYDGAAVNHSDFPFVKQDEWELIDFPLVKQDEGELIEQKVVEQEPAENSSKVSESSTEENDMTEYKKGFECGKQRVLKYPEDFGLCNNSADRFEPKFKDGDWIVYKDNIWKVCNIGLKAYYDLLKINNEVSTRLIKNVDENAHLWTIKDAKDGDVLVASDGSIFIFKCTIDCACKHYVALTTDGVVKFNEGLEHYWETSRAVHPATKEQSDTLKIAMADAGYTFDFEKKEFNKIEKEPYSEKLYKAIELYYYTYGNGKGGFDNLSLEKFKDIVKTFINDYGMQNYVWSEDDERNLKDLECILCCHKELPKELYLRSIDWIRDIKDRVQSHKKQ